MLAHLSKQNKFIPDLIFTKYYKTKYYETLFYMLAHLSKQNKFIPDLIK